MTTDIMNSRDLVEKAPDANLLREMTGYAPWCGRSGSVRTQLSSIFNECQIVSSLG